MKIYSDPRLLALGIIHGTAARDSGNMRQPENVRTLFDALSIPPDKILRFKQTHSCRLVEVSSLQQMQQIRQAPLQEADGWVITKASGYGAAILTADCVPLIIWNEQADVVALAHCGWRGVAAGLPRQTALSVSRLNGGGRLYAWAGPHIQSCCFEVQQDVAAQFPGCVLKKKGKLYVDLNKEITRQLTSAGLHETDIALPYYCTCGDRDHFFSYRRDHTAEALLTFIYRP